jgi:hypothetical protein
VDKYESLFELIFQEAEPDNFKFKLFQIFRHHKIFSQHEILYEESLVHLLSIDMNRLSKKISALNALVALFIDASELKFNTVHQFKTTRAMCAKEIKKRDRFINELEVQKNNLGLLSSDIERKHASNHYDELIKSSRKQIQRNEEQAKLYCYRRKQSDQSLLLDRVMLYLMHYKIIDSFKILENSFAKDILQLYMDELPSHQDYDIDSYIRRSLNLADLYKNLLVKDM